LQWVFPYPIDEMVKIPVERKVNLAVNSFWYYQTKDDVIGKGVKNRGLMSEKLEPLKDGYCLTRSAEQREGVEGSGGNDYGINAELRVGPERGGFVVRVRSAARPTAPAQMGTLDDGSDYNIVHSKWQITYQIGDIEQFFRNVYIEDIKPGQVYFDVMTKEVTPLIQDLFENAVVDAMVNYTIDEVMFEQVARVTEHVKKLLQDKLNTIDSGIKIIQVQLTDKTWPQQVDEAFSASIKASQDSQKAISEARTYAGNTLNEVAGPFGERLYAILQDGSATEDEKELLWSQLAGTAQQKIAEARAYRTKVVEAAKANADYLQRILPEYRKRPELVTQKIYQDTIEQVFRNVDEKFVIQPSEGAKSREVRVLLNRDPSLKPKSKEKEGQAAK
jgi:regulator of protease activity HflC (stomatin/prohibitin superfamily)